MCMCIYIYIYIYYTYLFTYLYPYVQSRQAYVNADGQICVAWCIEICSSRQHNS